MACAGVHVELRGHAGPVEAHGVVDVLVGEAVEGTGRHERGREPGQVLGPSGRGRVRHVRGPVEGPEVGLPSEAVVVPAPQRHVVLLARGSDLAVVEHRAVEQLERHRDLASVAGEQGERGGEAAARAQTSDADPFGLNPQFLGVGERPPQGLVAVLQRTRVRGLGGEAVADRDGDHAQPGAEVVEHRVVIAVVPQDEATAVDPHQARERLVDALRAVHADLDRGSSGHEVILADHPVGQLDRELLSHERQVLHRDRHVDPLDHGRDRGMQSVTRPHGRTVSVVSCSRTGPAMAATPRAHSQNDEEPGPLAGTGLRFAMMVGLAGFEPTTSSSRTRRATKLRYSP